MIPSYFTTKTKIRWKDHQGAENTADIQANMVCCHEVTEVHI